MPSDRNVCWHCWQKGKETSGKKAQLRWMYVVEGSKELLCAS
ncbi:hypothetical protein [Microseira wollei]|nr:hypothetical protein [Microseira wollei]